MANPWEEYSQEESGPWAEYGEQPDSFMDKINRKMLELSGNVASAPFNVVKGTGDVGQGGIKGLASYGSLLGMKNLPEPQNDLEGVGYFLGENAPYFAIPQAKFAQLNKFGNLLATGLGQGATIGGVESLKDKGISGELPMDIAQGAGTGLATSTIFGALPAVAGGVKRIKEILPKAMMSFAGINPKTFEYASKQSAGEASQLLAHPEFLSSPKVLNSLAGKFKENVVNYKKALSKKYGDITSPFEKSEGFTSELVAPEEIQTALYNTLKDNRLLDEEAKLTPLGKLSNAKQLDEFVGGYSGSPKDLVNLRRDIDKQFIKWNKTNENPSASDIALMNSAKTIRDYIDSALKGVEFNGAFPYAEADTIYSQGMSKLKTPSLERAYKLSSKGDLDKLGTELSNIMDKRYQGTKDFKAFENAHKELDPKSAKSIEKILTMFKYADMMPKQGGNAGFFGTAVRRSMARPVVEGISLPLARSKEYQALDRFVNSKLRDASRAKMDIRQILPFMMNQPPPLQGGVEYNEYR